MATGQMGQAADAATIAAQTTVAKSDTTAQEGLTLGEMQKQWSNQTLPQLQSGIAAAGETYGSANVAAQGNAGRQEQDARANIGETARIHLDDLTRQQTYATMGMIV